MMGILTHAHAQKVLTSCQQPHRVHKGQNKRLDEQEIESWTSCTLALRFLNAKQALYQLSYTPIIRWTMRTLQRTYPGRRSAHLQQQAA